MKAIIPVFAFFGLFIFANNSSAQNYQLKSSLMKSTRCGSNYAGVPKQIATKILIDESENIIRIIYADGTSAYQFKIQTVKHSDDIYGPLHYKLMPDGQGFHTVIYDRDPMRNWVILMRADNMCIIYAID
jgi:hypothetical protein